MVGSNGAGVAAPSFLCLSGTCGAKSTRLGRTSAATPQHATAKAPDPGNHPSELQARLCAELSRLAAGHAELLQQVTEQILEEVGRVEASSGADGRGLDLDRSVSRVSAQVSPGVERTTGSGFRVKRPLSLSDVCLSDDEGGHSSHTSFDSNSTPPSTAVAARGLGMEANKQKLPLERVSHPLYVTVGGMKPLSSPSEDGHSESSEDEVMRGHSTRSMARSASRVTIHEPKLPRRSTRSRDTQNSTPLSGRRSFRRSKYGGFKSPRRTYSENVKWEVLEVWDSDGSSVPYGGTEGGASVQTSAYAKTGIDDFFDIHKEPAMALARFCGKCQINPTSMKRTAWDYLGLLLVMYESFMVPLEFFDLPTSSFISVMMWFTRLFWTVDIPCSFSTGTLNADGSIDMTVRKSAAKYLRNWFGLDVVLVSLDWLEVFWLDQFSLGYVRFGKAARFFRIIRVARLLRLCRMLRFFKQWTELMVSEVAIVFMNITKLLLLILGLAHFAACIWYGIGTRRDVGTTWVSYYHIEDLTLAHRYMTSLHWSLSQYGGGMDEVTPENEGERIYAVCVFVFAFTIGSVFVSSLTSSMTQLHMIAGRQSQQISLLRTYLRLNGISHRLTQRIQRNAHHALSDNQNFLPEHSVNLLSVVSEPLRVELHFEVYSPWFQPHPFFSRYISQCPQVMRNVCHRAMSMSMDSRGDVVFHYCESPDHPKMYLVCSGSLSYIRPSGREFSLKEKTWISEAALWTTWIHRGDLMCTSDCRLCALDARSFQDIASQFHHQSFDVKAYAAQFVDALNAMEEVTDLPATAAAVYSIVEVFIKNSPIHGQHTESASQSITLGSVEDGEKICKRDSPRRRSSNFVQGLTSILKR